MSKLEINGEMYVKESEVSKQQFCGDYVIVRTYSAGVFAGNLVSRDGREVKLENARRLWYWKGACSLSQLAIDGVKCPSECKFAMPVTVTLLEAIEILEVTEEAEKNIEGVFVWKE
jgi:hypothetical protein